MKTLLFFIVIFCQNVWGQRNSNPEIADMETTKKFFATCQKVNSESSSSNHFYPSEYGSQNYNYERENDYWKYNKQYDNVNNRDNNNRDSNRRDNFDGRGQNFDNKGQNFDRNRGGSNFDNNNNRGQNFDNRAGFDLDDGSGNNFGAIDDGRGNRDGFDNNNNNNNNRDRNNNYRDNNNRANNFDNRSSNNNNNNAYRNNPYDRRYNGTNNVHRKPCTSYSCLSLHQDLDLRQLDRLPCRHNSDCLYDMTGFVCVRYPNTMQAFCECPKHHAYNATSCQCQLAEACTIKSHNESLCQSGMLCRDSRCSCLDVTKTLYVPQARSCVLPSAYANTYLAYADEDEFNHQRGFWIVLCVVGAFLSLAVLVIAAYVFKQACTRGDYECEDEKTEVDGGQQQQEQHIAAWDMPSLDYLSEEQTMKYLKERHSRAAKDLNNPGTSSSSSQSTSSSVPESERGGGVQMNETKSQQEVMYESSLQGSRLQMDAAQRYWSRQGQLNESYDSGGGARQDLNQSYESGRGRVVDESLDKVHHVNEGYESDLEERNQSRSNEASFDHDVRSKTSECHDL